MDQELVRLTNYTLTHLLVNPIAPAEQPNHRPRHLALQTFPAWPEEWSACPLR